MALVLEQRIAVRRATPADLAFVERVGREAFGEYDPRAGAHAVAIVTERGMTTLIATVAGEPAGFVAVDFPSERTTAHVQAIAVRARDRGRGLGERLMVAAERAAHAGGARSLRLVTAASNVEGLALFLKRGFVIERRLGRFYARGQDACALRKPLGG